MEIKNLTTFVHVAELNSFTKAAELLDYSQSTVSFQIKQLETELDCLLFERINHTLQITDKGRELLEYAHKVCQLTEEFYQNQKDATEINGRIHVVGPDSLFQTMLLENYADFCWQYPQIALKFSTADTDDMFRLLEQNEADVMLTLDEYVCRENFVIAKGREVSMHFVTGKQSPLAAEKELSVRDLLDTPFLLTERMGYRRALDEMLAKQGIYLRPTLEIGRTDIIMAVLKNGPGVSFLPDFVTRKEVERGTLAYLNVTDVNVDIRQQLIYHKSKWLSRALKTFIQYVSTYEFNRG